MFSKEISIVNSPTGWRVSTSVAQCSACAEIVVLDGRRRFRSRREAGEYVSAKLGRHKCGPHGKIGGAVQSA